MSLGSSLSGYIGMPSGYRSPASSGGYLLFSMKGIWVAVKATTSYSGLFLKKTLKLWKSLPAAPMITTRLLPIGGECV